MKSFLGICTLTCHTGQTVIGVYATLQLHVRAYWKGMSGWNRALDGAQIADTDTVAMEIVSIVCTFLEDMLSSDSSLG